MGAAARADRGLQRVRLRLDPAAARLAARARRRAGSDTAGDGDAPRARGRHRRRRDRRRSARRRAARVRRRATARRTGRMTADRGPDDRASDDLEAPAPLGVPVAGRTPDQQAVAMLAACLRYHQREEKPFWWSHYDRLISDPDEWTEKRSTFVADSVSVIEPWHVPPGKRAARRRLRMVGRVEPGSDLRVGAAAYALYDVPLPPDAKTSARGTRGWTEGITVLEVGAETDDDGRDGSGREPGMRVDGTHGPVRDVLVVEETLAMAGTRHDCLPMALGPSSPPKTAGIARVIRTLAERVAAGLPALPDQPALDLLRRVPPRTRGDSPLPAVIEGPRGYIDAIMAAVLDLDGL